MVTETKNRRDINDTADNSELTGRRALGGQIQSLDVSTLDLQTKTQMRIFRQLVTTLNTHLNQEITISLVTPLLTYLVAEVD